MINKLLCKIFGHKLIITTNKRNENGINIVKETKCKRCGEIFKYKWYRNHRRIKRRILRFMEEYQKSQKNSILSTIYNKIKELKKGKE